MDWLTRLLWPAVDVEPLEYQWDWPGWWRWLKRAGRRQRSWRCVRQGCGTKFDRPTFLPGWTWCPWCGALCVRD